VTSAPRAVADVNVLVSAARTPNGLCGRLLEAAIDGRWQPVVSMALFEELEDVLARPAFRDALGKRRQIAFSRGCSRSRSGRRTQRERRRFRRAIPTTTTFSRSRARQRSMCSSRETATSPTSPTRNRRSRRLPSSRSASATECAARYRSEHDHRR
jgi:hypothetical protein